MKKFSHQQLLAVAEQLVSFVRFFAARCVNQRVQMVAGYLSYVTLVSLVPLIVVMLSVLTAFPIFAEFRHIIENFVFSNFVPTAGETIQKHLTGFAENASKMSAIAISFLFLFALLLVSAIDKSLNQIWRIKEKRRVMTSLSMYWMILTLGPVLVGSSIAATSYVVSLVSFSDQDLLGATNFLLRLLPIMSSVAAFLILYMLVPNKDVKFFHALAGAILAGLLFELAKKGFALYVTQLPSYQAIYGALATIPILFVWVYLSWLVVLVGAVFTASIEEYMPVESEPEANNDTKTVS